jgi:hypothetical protein
MASTLTTTASKALSALGRALKAVQCTIFHRSDKKWAPVHHSWEFNCSKCGRYGLVDD